MPISDYPKPIQRLRRHPILAGVVTVTLLIVVLLLLLDTLFPPQIPSNNALFAQLVVDKDGKPLRAFADNNGVWRYPISLDDVSPLYIEALLAYEDSRFWVHPGVDPVAIVRAVVLNIWHQSVVSGGSTITMQVARLLHPYKKSLGGKLYQIVRAIQLEIHLSKKEILTLYCNIAPFGGTIEGVQAASFTYLNKPSSLLSHGEAALLAVLPQSPTRFRPDLHPLRAQNARDKVLSRLAALNVWPKKITDEAKQELVYAIKKSSVRHAPILSRRLAQEYSHPLIHTTLDADLQITLEDILQQTIEQFPEKHSAAVLVVENKTAEVKAYIGAADFGNTNRYGYVDMVRAIRSPGSTLKPFLYALSLDSGLIHSQSLLLDTPQNWANYRPGNFSGNFSGPVSATQALQRSLNIPAVALLENYGPDNFYGRLYNAGIKLSLLDNTPNLSLILGGTGTSLENLVQGYMSFANEGKTRTLKYLHDQPLSPEQFLFSPQAAWVVHDMLTGVGRADGVRNVAALASKQKMAWKTGTSYGYRDAWAIGVDAQYTVGVWVGRPDGTPVPGATGRSSAGPILQAVANVLRLGDAPIAQPEKITEDIICWPLGTRKSTQSSRYCHQEFRAWIIDETVPPTWPENPASVSENPFSFWVDAKTQKRVQPACTETTKQKKIVALWPNSVEAWIPKKNRRSVQIPEVAGNCSMPELALTPLKIESMENKNIYQAPSNFRVNPKVNLLASGGAGLHHWYINGKYYRTAKPANNLIYEFEKRGGMQVLVVDDSGNIDQVEITVQ